MNLSSCVSPPPSLQPKNATKRKDIINSDHPFLPGRYGVGSYRGARIITGQGVAVLRTTARPAHAPQNLVRRFQGPGGRSRKTKRRVPRLKALRNLPLYVVCQSVHVKSPGLRNEILGVIRSRILSLLLNPFSGFQVSQVLNQRQITVLNLKIRFGVG